MSILIGFALLLLCLRCSVQTPTAKACPFCPAIKPTLSQQREAARVVFLGEVVSQEKGRQNVNVKVGIKGEKLLGQVISFRIPLDKELPNGSLVLILENTGKIVDLKKMQWKAIPVSEVAISYFAGAPDLRTQPAKRLKYFSRFLEHRDQLIANDAFYEFAHNSYDEVYKVAKSLDATKLRKWIVDQQVPQSRKGFYGLALGFTAVEKQKKANLALMKKLILKPENDFRSGFDGLLCGYLIAEGEAAMELIEKRYLANPKAAHGDVRHAISAIQVYYESGNKKRISQDRLKKSMRHLLTRPEFASRVIADLARWEDWKCLQQVANLYGDKNYPQPATNESVVGYLSACTLPTAVKALESLRKQDPKGVEEAEKSLALFPEDAQQ